MIHPRRSLIRASALSAIVLAFWSAATPLAHGASSTISNRGSITFSICKVAASPTACTGPTGALSPGQNSRTKYSWEDTDMIYILSGCKLQIYTYLGGGQQGWADYGLGGSSGRWMKVPDPGGDFRMRC